MRFGSKKVGLRKNLSGFWTPSLGLLLMAAGLVGCEAEAPLRPNLVLITVDRMAADRLGCFGGASDAGGSVCDLGQRGTLFAWTASAGHGEASGAATVLTGLPESIHGVGAAGQSFLANAHATIAEDLSAAGYSTAAFVASARVNRSRRLDQGFDLYDDRLASPSRRDDSTDSVNLSSKVRAWLETAPSPWFVWIHADRSAGLVEFDRLLSRLSQTLERPQGGPGILFLALRGEREPASPRIVGDPDSDWTIGWRTHRVPLIWRPPMLDRPGDGPAPESVSRRLASLMDIRPTLRAAADLHPNATSRNPVATPHEDARTHETGRDLGAREWLQPGDDPTQERFLLLASAAGGNDVGLASRNHLYIRHASPLDGTGRPVPASSLIPLAARFASLPRQDPARDAAPRSASLEPGPWREDVLNVESPVSRLEFHLARKLVGEQGRNELIRRDIKDKRNLE